MANYTSQNLNVTKLFKGDIMEISLFSEYGIINWYWFIPFIPIIYSEIKKLWRKNNANKNELV